MMNRTITSAVIFTLTLMLTASAYGAGLKLTKFQYQGAANNESMTLRNSGRKTIALGESVLSSGGVPVYTLPVLKLKPRQKITIQSGAGTNVLRGRNKRLFIGSETEIWPDNGGTLNFAPKRGRSVSRSYGDQASAVPRTVFFIHHSTGQIYWDGGLRAALQAHGYSGSAPWWDGGTDPGDFPALFRDSANWDIFGDYGIIIFKSCFPASDIGSSGDLEQYKAWYRELYAVFSANPNKLFVPLSTPPLLKAHTSAASAARALQFENWLMGEFKTQYEGKNLAPFRLHSLLSDDDGYLAAEFISSPSDDHPNNHSGQVVGAAIWPHLDEALEAME